jgi:uncharacterized membrane protein
MLQSASAATAASAAYPTAQEEIATTTRSRVASIDVMRGLVIVLMLVDHVRERFFLHIPISDPMNVVTTTPDLFFTRLVAHLCAPTFVFLTGLGAWLYAHPAGGGPRSPRDFLIKRGLLLILIEITLLTLLWWGPTRTVWLQVIWAIGLSMIVLGLLSGLPRWLLAALGFAIVFGHNLLTPISFQPGEPGYTLWTILHDRQYLVAEGPFKIKVSYPVLPWIGVILIGYAAGPLYSRIVSASRRVRLLLALGAACMALLLVLRSFNIYGETLAWTHGESFVRTLMSWLNFTKYPPSLNFLLLTLGIALLLMAWFESVDNWLTRALAVFGQAPMFFYIIHLYVLLALYSIMVAAIGPIRGDLFGIDSVRWIWIIAAILAFALYFPTRAFARYKRTSKQTWVRYFRCVRMSFKAK